MTKTAMWSLSTALFFVCCVEFIEGGAKFLLTVPEKPHYDTEFTATVSAFGIYQKEEVYVEYRGVKDSSRLLNSTILSFDDDGVKSWTVVFPWLLMEKFQERSVSLTMSTMYNEAKKTLYFSRSTGYILIQTDKPLYTPRQTVKFRIIAVDEYQRWAKYPLKVDIKNDKGIVVDRMRYTAEDAFKRQEFELPKETQPGNWTISANYEGMGNMQGYVHTVTFEVKEYVLPRFSANIDINENVITKSTNWITIQVSAKYVYGQRVLGSAEMSLGIWDPKTGLKMLPGRYAGNLTNGIWKKNIRISNLIPKKLIVRENRRLYINVNVTEEGTQENDTIVDTSTFIAHPYYDITFKNSKTHFKPGFPYTLQTQVRARSGRPASWLNLWIEAIFNDKAGKKIGGKKGNFALDGDGRNVQDFDIPSTAHSIQFKTTVLDFKAGSNNNNEWTVPVLQSPNKQYMHITLVKPLKKYADGLVKLKYTPPYRYVGFKAPIQRITFLVLSRGHIVFSISVVRNTDGQSLVVIPRRLYTEVAPSMRMVASFHHKGPREEEFVTDSLKVDTDEACVEELSMSQPLFASPLPKKPGENYKIQIRGGPAMHVGFVAVDKAVFLLNDAHTLTRESVFRQFDSHDQGKGIGDGEDLAEMMSNSGLIHMVVNAGLETKKAGYGEPEVSKVRSGKLVGKGAKGMRIAGEFGLALDINREVGPMITEGPPQTVRRYFPESWLFDEHVLPKSGRMNLNLTLPDSITTWSFMAVGISARRGVCVSRRLEQRVQKLFFVDVRLPYKVTRLEEVKVKIAVYNYHTEAISINVGVSGSDGLCFSSNRYRGTQQNYTSFRMNIGKGRTKGKVVKIIPLNNGDLTLTVDASNRNERDVVEKKLYVVAEGLKKRKSLTFVLDPEAKHATYNKPSKKRRITLSDTATFKNTIDMRQQTQKTKVDLAMPKEVIRGTENCKISAFGDLMGDIINHAVIKSKSLLDQTVQNAEEVLGDLGPTVHALLYANMAGLMDQELSKRAKRFVKHGVARLLRYRKDQAFSLTPTSPEATWLTATVLKTLCHSSSLAFIDKEMLIDHGFYWLLQQVKENETFTERDWRLAKDSWDYHVMLSADVLIALMECGKSEFEDHAVLMYDMAVLLEDNIELVEEPMVLAKVAYALSLFDAESEFTIHAVKKLGSISRKNRQGQVYWSSEVVTNERKKVPFWYHKGVKASAIEATAYALLVFLQHRETNVDAIADWLVSQRNSHGIFISALDSMAAIQALSSYSLLRQGNGLKVDLSCNVSSDRKKNYTHSFKFTEKNAIKPESLSNVPVGHTLDVLTKGQGLGQMQINVEYNVPIDPNEKCPYNVTVEVKRTEVNFYTDMIDDPICMSCSWGCRPKVVNTSGDNDTLWGNETLSGNETFWENETMANLTEALNVTTTEAPTTPLTATKKPVVSHPHPAMPRPRHMIRKPRLRVKTRKNPLHRSAKKGSRPSKTYRVTGRRARKPRRKTRSVRNHSSASRRSICIKVCLQYVDIGSAGHTRVEVDMLTGYQPIASHIERLKEYDDVLDAWYVPEKDSVIVDFKQVGVEEKTCIAFVAVDQEEVGRPTPATVLVTEVGNPAPSCAVEYKPPLGQESLQVYCADFSRSNRGECRCYSGICSSCTPNTRSEIIGYSDAKNLVCKSDVGYQLQVAKVQDRDQWVEIDATILSINKTGTHQVKPKDTIKMISPSSCVCPTFFGTGKEVLYMISPDVEKMVDRFGKVVHTYLLDEQSVFMRVGEQNATLTNSRRNRRQPPFIPHVYMRQAFRKCTP